MKKPKKNKAAAALVAIRWAKTTKAERIAHSQKMNAALKKKLDTIRKAKVYSEAVESDDAKVADDAGNYGAR